jgi:hypothetical protein
LQVWPSIFSDSPTTPVAEKYMIYENSSGTHKTPRWAQKLLSRSRHPACVLLDIVGKALKDSAPILVQYRGKFCEVNDLTIEYHDDSGISIRAAFVKKGAFSHSITELVSTISDCVLEARTTKFEALRRRIKRQIPDISEYRLYFEISGKRVSGFEFYLDPRNSPRLIASYNYAHDVSKILDADPDDDNASSDGDFNSFMDQPLAERKEGNSDAGELQFIKIS